MSVQRNKIKEFIVQNLKSHPADIVTYSAEKLKKSRMSIFRSMQKLIADGLVLQEGHKKGARYFLVNDLKKTIQFSLKKKIEEHKIFEEYILDKTRNLPKNIQNILFYGFTEMVNNCVDHSKGDRLEIEVLETPSQFIFIIKDNGIGFVKNVQNYFKFVNSKDTFFQLTKGRLTTDPKNHSGEGLFFTSRVFDYFKISANGQEFVRDNELKEWTIKSIKEDAGTCVELKINKQSKTKLEDVFRQYEDDDHKFTKTDIYIDLSREVSDRLISRSQAKRVCERLSLFKKVTLDFKGVDTIGQGFVDELFRVFKKSNPEIVFTVINANEDVKYMISRGSSE